MKTIGVWNRWAKYRRSVKVSSFQALVIWPPIARGVPAEVFLVEGFREAAMGVTLTLANARQRM